MTARARNPAARPAPDQRGRRLQPWPGDDGLPASPTATSTATPSARWASAPRSPRASPSARPDVKVICLDGDGSLLMNLGSLCTTRPTAPAEPRARGLGQRGARDDRRPADRHRPPVQPGGLARGAGIEKVLEPRTRKSSERAYERILSEEGPCVVPVKVEKGPTAAPFDPDVIGPPARFRKALAAL